MVKKFGKGKPREPTKKEKLQRGLEQKESERLGKKYVYPITIGAVISFFIGLYLYLYFKSLSR